MNIVYALQTEDDTVAIFSTEELAAEAARQCGTGEVVRWVIDEIAPLVMQKLPFFTLRMLHDGTIAYIKETTGGFVPYVWFTNDYSCMYANYRVASQEEAIALAHAARLERIAAGKWPEPNAYWAPINAANGFSVYPQPQVQP